MLFICRRKRTTIFEFYIFNLFVENFKKYLIKKERGTVYAANDQLLVIRKKIYKMAQEICQCFHKKAYTFFLILRHAQEEI